ncbi:MAG: DUF6468 domain-containing protein [Devosia sp.]
MLGLSMGLLVEGSVSILLTVTIGYCMVLNQRLKGLHQDREMMVKTVAELVQATALANSAVRELKAAALEADTSLTTRLEEAAQFHIEFNNHLAAGSQLIEKIARITAAARANPVAVPEPSKPASDEIDSTSKLHSALQQLAMRPGIGGRAA